MEKGISIIYEDKWLIVVDKPAGMLSMSTGKSGRPNEVTAYNLLTDYVRESRSSGRIFIVHRLDRDTSGLLVFANDEDTKLSLQENWNEAVLERKYVAVLEGCIKDDEGWIESWLYENPKSMKVHCYSIDDRDIDAAREGRCRFAERNGWKYASTHCITTHKGKEYTQVEFDLETGRKNQIRAHAQWIGHPIAGDKKYGARTNPIGRLALHAKSLSFIHPWTGKTMSFSSPAPKAFKKLTSA
jgi:23S rRNA pseudouridine1911/1915/1917 synthase